MEQNDKEYEDYLNNLIKYNVDDIQHILGLDFDWCIRDKNDKEINVTDNHIYKEYEYLYHEENGIEYSMKIKGKRWVDLWKTANAIFKKYKLYIGDHRFLESFEVKNNKLYIGFIGS